MVEPVRVAQNSPEALEVLAASLRCDQVSRRFQVLYWAMVQVGLALLAFNPFLTNEQQTIGDGSAIVQAAIVIATWTAASRWRDRGSVLRADFERIAFGFPWWTLQGGELTRIRSGLARAYLASRQAGQGGLRDWFQIRDGLPHASEVLLSEYQSVLYGQRLRAIWSRLLFAAGAVVAVAAVATVIFLDPTTPASWYVFLVPMATLPTVFTEAIGAHQYARNRSELLSLIERVGNDRSMDLESTVTIVHERLVAIRENRVLVPHLLYQLSRSRLHRTALEAHPAWVALREMPGEAESV